MQQLIDFLAANPWIWFAIAVGLAIWIAALWVIFRSGKFRRRWLWVLLSLLMFGYGWEPSPGLQVSVGLPVGALYVLGFWRFGPPPPKALMERDAETRERQRFVLASAGKVRILRFAYWTAAAATGLMAWLAISGAIMGVFLAAGSGAGPHPELAGAGDAMGIGSGLLLLLFAGLFVFLSFRPYWWGKLICAWAGLAWCMFGLISGVVAGPQLTSPLVLAAGLTVLAAGLVHQLTDPRFSGSYLRSSPASSAGVS